MNVLNGFSEEGLAASSSHLTHEETFLVRVLHLLKDMPDVPNVDAFGVQVGTHFAGVDEVSF